MNQHLQSLLDFIEQDKSLSADEKKALLKSLKDADKELEITSFKLDRTEKVKRTIAILLEETIEELENKRKAVEAQNRELEIESSLERVRTVAMSMNKPDDMLQVCRTISEQLELLKVKEIRNVQTAIFYKEKGTYMNYEYYAKHDKTIVTETVYTNHKIARDFANQMLKGSGEFMVAHIKGDEVKAWVDYQKTTNVFIDDYLYIASSLNYYWFSLGPVALGISTYDPLSEEETNLFKRFLKVFELSYRRYLDIEKAEAQAHEAKVEASLEKVRAAAMSMSKPDDLLNICETLFKEFTAFGFADLRNAMINIHNDEDKTFVNYDYSDEIGKSTNHLVYDIHPVIEKQVQQMRSANDAFSETVFAGKDLTVWKKFRRKIGEKDDPRIKKAKALYYYFYSIGTGSIGISTFSAVNDENIKLLKRFRNVFNLSYQRYTDLALAEAQAKEAKIEAALERVRAQAMSIRKSEELAGVGEIIFEQLKLLGFTDVRNTEIIINNDTKESIFSYYYSDYGITGTIEIFYKTNPTVQHWANELKKANDAFAAIEISENEMEAWRKYREEIGYQPDPKLNEAKTVFYYSYSTGLGALSISSFTKISYEQIKTLERFRNVFGLAYRRYADVAQAEAQARESQIELGLERVRARAMAMQKSDELSELVDTVFKELTKLDFALTWCIINIIDENSLSNTVWAANPDIDKAPESFYMKFEDYPFHHAMMKGWKERNAKYVYVLEGTEKKTYDEYLFNETEFRKVPEAAQAASRAIEKYVVSFSFSNFGGLQTVGDVPLSDANLDILSRFGKVFDLTYTRFNDLKQAEAQARESQIQLALERVRARTMAMQKSDELAETASLLFKQLLDLGIKATQMRTCAITTLKSDEPIGECWITKPDGDIIPQSFMVPYDETSAYKTIYTAWKNGEKFLVLNLSGEALVEHLSFLKKYAKIPTQQFQALPDQPRETFTHVMFFSQGYLFVISNEPLPEYNEIFKRFGAVFQQTYTRFLDLQKAEAQAREAQIELALERVRARTMAMQKSDELAETAYILYQQFGELGKDPVQISIGTVNENERVIELWLTKDGNQMNRTFKTSIDEPIVMNKIYVAWKEKRKSFVIDISGQQLKKYNDYRKSISNIEFSNDSIEDRRVISIAFFSKGLISVSYTEPAAPETIQLLERFAAVFDGTYTRFLDLQKAEAQARESQIEAALEKVRSRSLAMHKSDELEQVVAVVNEKLWELGLSMEDRSTSMIIFKEGSKDLVQWVASHEYESSSYFKTPYFDHPIFNDLLEAKESGTDFFYKAYAPEVKNSYFRYFFANSDYKLLPDTTKKWILENEHYALSIAYTKNSALAIVNLSGKPLLEKENDILKRFSRVFEQSYVRFLDLQKAEAQTREAQIETALERVRSRTMGMQKSEELTEVIQLVYEQFIHLNIHIEHTGFVIDYKVTEDYNIWIADPLGVPSQLIIPYFDSVYYNRFNEAKEKGEDFFATKLSFEEKNRFYQKLFEYVPGLTEEAKEFYFSCPGLAASTVLLENVGLYIENFSGTPYSDDDNNTLMRFGKVFQQTYTRFNDLQKAEVQVLEAVKRASVDRVRAEIASMRTTNDLERITPLIWNELTVLGIPFIRCGVFIMDEEQEKVQTFLYTEGKTIASFTSTFSNSKIIPEALPYWRKKEIYKTHWDEAAFLEQAKSLVEQGSITAGEKYLTEHRPTDLYLHFLPFLQGMLYVGNAAPLSEEYLQLAQALADAFSTAYARYEDFNKLEAAKQQVDKTLVDLKQTQAQLVQSEKMASLGELTAGIAHEIQNPLNFVNNFSEVNKELLAELNEEIEKGNYEEVRIIANDVISNEEKINHHGKRADAIVKGMLQHSRSSTGVKEPADINVLADEYLRLAYHGLRAKDKSFNAALKKDYDENIGSINIVPQDIGRAVLNLITNAFYAVAEKEKSSDSSYEPTISVSTKKSGNQVFISVRDNGNGIPQKAIDKIFQPFFTTKPTGQGTGLGLSLSYDIIKAHGGEIKMETEEGEGTEFIIALPLKY